MFIVWRGFLYNQYNQIEAILSQYEMEIYEVTKGRGTYICTTDKGKFVLTAFRGTKEKGLLLKEYLQQLKEFGFSVEQIILNKEMQAITEDEVTEERFLLKEYISGSELNVNHPKELQEAAALLAEYHNASSCTKQIESSLLLDCSQMVLKEKEKHYRELVKVKNYIRNCKKKTTFERIYLGCYESMFGTARTSIVMLEEQKEEQPACCFCHGDYNQHNVVFSEDKWKIINFENFVYRWSILDLANFIRKMQEKNEWDLSIGNKILESYTKVRPLSDVEYRKLYGLLLFPEKFWKVTNHYMNSRKSWISERDIEKLEKVIDQEAKRLNFTQNVFAIQRE